MNTSSTREMGAVYLLYEENWALYKLGFTTQSVYKRIKQINDKYKADFREVEFIVCSSPADFERLLHRIFSGDRLTDRREWFNLTEDQVALFRSIAFIQQNTWNDAYERAYEKGYDEGFINGYGFQPANEEESLAYWREYEEQKANARVYD